MTTQEQATPVPAPDDGGIRERAGWAPLRHFAERSVLGLLVVIAIGLGFGLLLLLVRLHWQPLVDVDRGVAQHLNEVVSPRSYVVNALNGISRLGGRPVMMWLLAIVVALLLIRRRTRLAVYLVVTGVGALLLDPSVKSLVGRLRPVVDMPVAIAPGNSFPSGHALGSMVVYGGLLLVFLPAVRRRKLFSTLTAVLVFAIGATRVALGVHYLSDVLAGWLLGALWLSVTAYAFRVWRREAGHPVTPIGAGLEPEAAEAVKPAPDGGHLVPHPWVKAAEILTGWVLTFGILYALGQLLKNYTEGTAFGRFDDGVPRWLQSMRTPALDDLSYLWSKAGDTHAILIISLVFCPVALAVWRQWRPVLFLVLTMVGELTLFLCVAASVQRDRPPVEQLDGQLPTSSFPSGHIAATMCVWVAIAVVVLGRVTQRWRYLFVALAVVMPAGVALSRMYRGMHHPSDLLGAAVLTTLWVGLLWWVIRPNSRPAGAGERVTDGEASLAEVRT
jgi:undecaprenyl-diphosphatase